MPADHPDLLALTKALEAAHSVPVFQNHRVYRRRERWAVEAPLGAFTGDFATSTFAREYDALWTLLRAAKKRMETGRVYPFTPSQQIFYAEERIFLREHAVVGLVDLLTEAEIPHTALLMQALKRYHTALVDGSVNMFPAEKRHFVPLERRPVVNGHRARGPAWTLAEDNVLRSFFGRQADGKRIILTEMHWNMVLNHPLFKAKRTKTGILQRMNILNYKLKKSLMVEGYLHPDGVVTWQQQRLGQRNRVPGNRFRLAGEYRAQKPKRVRQAIEALTPPQPPSSPSTPETPAASTATPAPSPAQTAVSSEANPPT